MTAVPPACLLESPTSAQRAGRRAPDRGRVHQEWAADDISDGESVWSLEVHPESRAQRLSAKFGPIDYRRSTFSGIRLLIKGQTCASPSSKSQTSVRTRLPYRGLPSDMRRKTRTDASASTKGAPSAGRRTPRLQRNRFNYSFVWLASGSSSERSPRVSPSARDLWTARGQNRRSPIQRATCSSCAVLQFLS